MSKKWEEFLKQLLRSWETYLQK